MDAGMCPGGKHFVQRLESIPVLTRRSRASMVQKPRVFHTLRLRSVAIKGCQQNAMRDVVSNLGDKSLPTPQTRSMQSTDEQVFLKRYRAVSAASFQMRLGDPAFVGATELQSIGSSAWFWTTSSRHATIMVADSRRVRKHTTTQHLLAYTLDEAIGLGSVHTWFMSPCRSCGNAQC
jgi:hypothetical protein